ncbi:S-methyl-5-thioribose-1-phosphate isomerase [Myxosarcina sp. GI1]|uniref:S-methyl-5-thioribose-1-phosphate isomerase n=1 Tax=Myxosarcina sp. GI1 TaxID=1541065 RepID=UPI00056A55E8|nr:S-methyl-5-thioribose-1-phosphate isomerase [Myxosarcina sp. GI1]
MKINNKHYHTIWVDDENTQLIQVFDQRFFPHEIKTFDITNTDEAAFAIKEMVVRGAPLIGVTAAYGMYLGCIEAKDRSDRQGYLTQVANKLNATRPTAVNLSWAIKEIQQALSVSDDPDEKIAIALAKANQIKQDDIEVCYRIGQHGLKIIQTIAARKNRDGTKPVNILTHCNAGWLATIDWGTATAPIYQAHEAGINVHVWVDETRPRNQGANLTAFELNQQNVPHTLINDNTGGHLMQHGMVDLVLVGTDRTARNGDVANKIGTYLKALAAHDNQVPFYVALPSSTLDCSIENGVRDIPIETRDEKEVKYIQGRVNGEIKSVLLCPETTPAANYGFDVTPAKYVTGLITERGVCAASEEGIKQLFPEKF